MSALALDADILAYRCAAACADEPLQECENAIDGMIETIIRDTGISRIRFYLSGANNFRYKVATTKPYKGNRKGDKPVHLQAARDYLSSYYGAITVEGYEADDAIASDMVANGAIHCGQDKDIEQIAGRHYNFVKKEWKHVSDSEATLNFYRQILMGDSTDNITGIRGTGAAKATAAIHDAETAEADAKDYYREHYEGDDVAAYWKEQVLLVQMVTTLSIINLVTYKVDVPLL